MTSELSFRTRKVIEFFAGVGLSSAIFIGLLLLWELAADAAWINPMFSSSPSRVVEAGIEMVGDGTLEKHIKASGQVFFAGFGLAVLFGVPIGVALGWFKWLNRGFSPLVSAFYTMPRIALRSMTPSPGMPRSNTVSRVFISQSHT